MKKSIAIATLFVLSLAPLSGHCQDDKDAVIKQLQAKIAQLEERIAALEKIVLPVKSQLTASSNREAMQTKARERMMQDREKYSQSQLAEIEQLYQVANKNWRSEEAVASLEKLTREYMHANRTGCAVLYLGQMSEGDKRLEYYQRAIKDFGDCFYGDGVQVGAYARFLLAYQYKQDGKDEEARALYDELLTMYPGAIDHSGRLLSENIPK